MVEAEKTENLEFKWGVLKGTGGKNRDVKFYKSFRYDGEDYDLFDCVYLYKEGEPEPEIGKIIKIWETPQKLRKVKILWFFRPCEISNFLGDEKILENELFLASGAGTGLHNLNPLEAIAGKCNVLCISKDKENPQPSDEELQKADFVFHRTFDVSQQKIMDKIEGKIADVDVKFLFNKINVQKPAGDLNVDLGENKVCDNDTKTNDTMVPSKQNSFKEPKNVETTRSSVDKHILSVEKQKSAAVGLESGEMDQTDERQQDVSSPKTILCSKGRGREEEANLDNVLSRKLEVEETRSTKEVGDLDNRPTKKLKLDTSKASSDKINSHEPRHVEVDGICGRKNNAILDHTLPEKPNMNASRSGEHKHKVNANGSYMKDLSFVASLVDERCKLKGVEDTIGTNKSSTKKMKPDGNTSTPSNNKFPKSSHGDDESKVQNTSSPSSSIVDDRCKHKEESPVGDKDSKKKMKVVDKTTNLSLVGDKDSKKKMKVGDKVTNLSTGKPPKPSLRPPQNKTQKFDGQLLEVTQRADASDVDGNDNKASSPIAFGFDDSLGKRKAPFEKMKSDVKAPRLSNREMGEQSTTQSLIKSGKFDGQVVEVTQRPGTIAFDAAEQLQHYQQANPFVSQAHTHPPATAMKWNPPPPSMLKANFDGSVLPPSCAAAGFVVRNCNGLPVLATSQNLGHMDILLAEAVALRDGLQLLTIYTTQPLLVEGDSKLLMDALTGRSRSPKRIKMLVQDIKALSGHFNSVSFKHVLREENFLADSLAKFGHSISSPQLWLSSLPLSSTSAFHLDFFGGGCALGFSL